ncbi:cytochrome b5 [Aulographum hederae CBS 113979]|uniref:Cytochrome b5 n=1 Tax=Aulographum hederae CBS 113979 TaxID=1176131 RepID=A0A6G1H1Z4_9PEZI|nr:cytochrome b5 [Aulographum hederae CBS 113979]
MADTENLVPPPPAEAAPLMTPINLILISFFVVMAYLKLRPSPPVTLPKGPAPVVFKTFTPKTLLPNNGTNNQPVYLAVRGKVFDVTPGRNFYGPGGPYQNFAGRDATRGLACGSFDESMLTEDLEGPLDDLKGLGDDEMDALRGWEERFTEKYLAVGKLVPANSEEAKEAGL